MLLMNLLDLRLELTELTLALVVVVTEIFRIDIETGMLLLHLGELALRTSVVIGSRRCTWLSRLQRELTGQGWLRCLLGKLLLGSLMTEL